MGCRVEKLIFVALVGGLVGLFLQKSQPQLARGITLGAGVLLLCLALPRAVQTAQGFAALFSGVGLAAEGLGIALKVTGLSLLGQFGAQFCRDLGQDGLAQKVEFAARICVLAAGFPAISGLFALIGGMVA